MVELVDADDEVFGKDLFGGAHLQGVGLVVGDLEGVVGVYTGEGSDTVIEVVLALAQREVDDVDGVDLLHLLVAVSEAHVVGDDFRHAVKNTFQIVSFARELHLRSGCLCQHLGRRR